MGFTMLLHSMDQNWWVSNMFKRSTSVLTSGFLLAETPIFGWVNWSTHRKTERMYPWHLGMMWVWLKNDWTWETWWSMHVFPQHNGSKCDFKNGENDDNKTVDLGYTTFSDRLIHMFLDFFPATSGYHGRVSAPNRQTKSVETKPSLAVCSHDCTQTWAVKQQPLKANMYKSFSQDEVWM